MLSSARGKRLLHSLGLLGPIKTAADRKKKGAWLSAELPGPTLFEQHLREMAPDHSDRLESNVIQLEPRALSPAKRH